MLRTMLDVNLASFVPTRRHKFGHMGHTGKEVEEEARLACSPWIRDQTFQPTIQRTLRGGRRRSMTPSLLA